MKQLILDHICGKLNDLQIPFSLKNDSYIYVNTAFYEVGYGSDFKKILYELTVYLDESNRSVYMYVKTLDQCLVSANGDTHAVSTPSSTMFRKVKRFCYDQDGKGSVVTTDLGEVPNTVKNMAFKFGWKFSTALNMNKLHKEIHIKEDHFELPDVSLTLPETETPLLPQKAKVSGSSAPLKRVIRRILHLSD